VSRCRMLSLNSLSPTVSVSMRSPFSNFLFLPLFCIALAVPSVFPSSDLLSHPESHILPVAIEGLFFFTLCQYSEFPYEPGSVPSLISFFYFLVRFPSFPSFHSQSDFAAAGSRRTRLRSMLLDFSISAVSGDLPPISLRRFRLSFPFLICSCVAPGD